MNILQPKDTHNRIKFIAALFVASLCAFTISVFEYIEKSNYEVNVIQVSAVLVGDYTNFKYTHGDGIGAVHKHTIKYDVNGKSFVSSLYFDAGISKALIDNKSLDITVLSNNPKRVYLSKVELPSGLLWFTVGCVLLILAWLSYRLLKQHRKQDPEHNMR